MNNKKKDTYFNYSIYPYGGYTINQKLYKNDKLINNSAYIPRFPEVCKNKSFNIYKEEEKVNNESENYINSLNAQIFKLESQIEQLQNKVYELNSQNKTIDKDKKKIKNYEYIIEKERHKAKKAENTIYNLKQEIEMLKKSYNLNYISVIKNSNEKRSANTYKNKEKKLSMILNDIKNKSQEKEENIFNNNKKLSFDSKSELNEISKNTERKNKKNKKNRKKDCLKNSNDIQFRITDETEKNNLSEKRNINIPITEELSSQGNSSNNFSNNRKIIFNQNVFNKMKGSDIDSSNNKLYSRSNAIEETNNNSF